MERRVVNPWTWQENFGFHQGHEVTGAERTLYLSGQLSTDDDGAPIHEGDMAAQINRCLDNIETVLAAADMTLTNVVRLNIYTTDVDELLAHGATLGRLKAAGCQYSSTLLGISRLAYPESLVEIEATAVA